MVCTSAFGEKVPLAVVGKSAKSRCFKFAEKPPLPYTTQQRAWFDRKATEWWVVHVFVPHVRKVHGDVWVVLILDNCPAHPCNDVDKFHSHEVFIIFLPKNMTSRFQPADMGMISALKTRYKSIYLRRLVALCGDEDAYDTAKSLAKGMQAGAAGCWSGIWHMPTSPTSSVLWRSCIRS
jgi:hypothetical protein